MYVSSKPKQIPQDEVPRLVVHEKPKNIQRLVKKLNKKTRRDTTDNTSREKILEQEVDEFLGHYNLKHNASVARDDIRNSDSLIESFLFTRSRPKVILEDVEVLYHTSEAEGFALVPKSRYPGEFNSGDLDSEFSLLKIPKTVVGDIVTVELLMHNNLYVECALREVQNLRSRSTIRRNEQIVCGKFDECSGCQLQMLRYEDQLEFKQKSIQKAYRFFYPNIFEELSEDSVGNVMPSPRQYSYRTKITPHYKIKRDMNPEDIIIGFNNVNPTQKEVDIDMCPIATSAINDELRNLRHDIVANVASKTPKRSQSTAIVRESIRIDFKTGNYDTVALTSPKKIVTTKIEDCVFQFPATEFFQNNDSILPHVLDYIEYHMSLNDMQYRNIIDTYCGSGFFGISLARRGLSDDGKVFGVELSKGSLDYASHNARINGLNIPDKIQFVHGSADTMFTNSEFRKAGLKGHESVVIMDPSRKGSNESFLQQLLDFKPKLVLYVSCNVFTQARDIATIMRLQEANPVYRVRDVKGFDFFPQTKHVESVAVLELLD